jgi:hypothetical protein
MKEARFLRLGAQGEALCPYVGMRLDGSSPPLWFEILVRVIWSSMLMMCIKTYVNKLHDNPVREFTFDITKLTFILRNIIVFLLRFPNCNGISCASNVLSLATENKDTSMQRWFLMYILSDMFFSVNNDRSLS